ncbi:hypothetical protein [Streptomyces sp. URMC 124]|uniref:hypothetical protein n=1 Tax=Streptomyces sp. URMC 124 TaxID=3423405 RepID=UPI003F1A1BE3
MTDTPMTLPAAVERALQAKEGSAAGKTYGDADETLYFIYRAEETDIELAHFVGPFALPAEGRVVTLWGTGDEFVVHRVESHYAVGAQGRPVALHKVLVRPACTSAEVLADGRVRVKVVLVFGDQAEITADAPDALAPERYPAEEVAAQAGVPVEKLAGRRLTASVGKDGRLVDFRRA